MQLKINNKYKKIGNGKGFTTQPGQIVKVFNVDSDRVHYYKHNTTSYELSLPIGRFIKEFILVNRKISFKGLL